ncbi:MAG: hypothetical protein K8J09_03650 [Planctomycetes bacterium]|nr:hypothetical protein [Planctomycetota bacterium]MCC7399247.1 hypothetical protein [Planctomycetota bacterium]
MDGKTPILRLVLVPALLTLVVSVVRLLGELYAWSPFWFGVPEGGAPGVPIGISWLIFVFGFWFGLRLQRAGAGPQRPGRAALICLVGALAAAGLVALFMKLGLMTMPDKDAPKELAGIGYFLCAMGLGVVVAFVAWPRLALTMLAYAVLARLPVVGITWLAVHYDWQTHYAMIGEGMLPPPREQLFQFLATPQVTFWPAVTVLFGTLCGSLAALVSTRRR